MIIPKADRLNLVKEYYFVRKLEEIAKLNKEGKNVINFGIGSPDLAPSKETVQAIVATAEKDNTHGYQPYRGIPEFRQKIAEWYKKTYKVDLNPNDEVLPLLGSKEGILHLTMAFLNPGEEVLVPNPGYPGYSSLTMLAGGTIRYYDLKEENNWFPDFDALRKADLSRVKIMWVNYPHMPTGTVANKEMLKKLIEFAKEKRILICYDNPYSLVLNKEEPFSILQIEGAKEVAVELNSFSKSHNMAGWRVGMMLGKKEYLDAALAIKSNIDSGMFLGIQQAAMKALDNNETWHAKRNDVYRERRDWVYKILDLLNFEYSNDQVGLFIWAKPKDPIAIPDIAAFVDQILYSSYVFFTPGEIFGSNGKNFLRLSLCVPAERMKEAYERLEKVLTKA
ncbi:aminotransferase [Sporocytophaga myxococcoides]|uniref:Aminotransferase n=1 Tax=Sporocytophaga myxococcoides TaxID=153721 RepID=A0A098L9L3_9BACT|nr:aminotransferase class I/II-fold pyridoxal phosphate-dependent enzyme [Sporocytophaga myxococcoides]GAL82808.1 aminotransferase [Sporocytophaga myxococcoides]